MQSIIQTFTKFCNLFRSEPVPVLYIAGSLPKIIEKFPKYSINLVVRKYKDSEDLVIGFVKTSNDLQTGEMIPFEMTYDARTEKLFRQFDCWNNFIPTLTITEYEPMPYMRSRKMSVLISTRYRTQKYRLVGRDEWYDDKKKSLPFAPPFARLMYITKEGLTFEEAGRSVASFEDTSIWRGSGRIRVLSMDQLVYFLGKYGTGPHIVHYSGQTVTFYSLPDGKYFSFSGYDDDDD